MRLFRPRNLLILAIVGTAVAVVVSKKNRPADPLPTVSYTPPAPVAEKAAEVTEAADEAVEEAEEKADA